MKKGLTELVFILDKSGSMQGLESDTIGGFNGMLAKQQAIDGEALVTTVLFSDEYCLLHDRIDIKAVKPIGKDEYQAGGSTALLDAIGRTINKISNAQKNTAEDYRAEKVMFVIITDGEENSSREYSLRKVKESIDLQKSKFGWEFVFLGANIDAVSTASRFGISASRAVNYVPDAKGTEVYYAAMSDAVGLFRMEGEIDEISLKEIQEDFEERGKRD